MNSLRRTLLGFFLSMSLFVAQSVPIQAAPKHYSDGAKIFAGQKIEHCIPQKKDFCACFVRESIKGCRKNIQLFSGLFCSSMPRLLFWIKVRGGGNLKTGIRRSCYSQFRTKYGARHCLNTFHHFLSRCYRPPR